jgi:hypothetical protein
VIYRFDIVLGHLPDLSIDDTANIGKPWKQKILDRAERTNLPEPRVASFNAMVIIPFGLDDNSLGGAIGWAVDEVIKAGFAIDRIVVGGYDR